MKPDYMNARLLITIVSNIVWEALIVAAAVWLLPLLGIKIPLWGIILITVVFAIYAAFMYKIGSRILIKKVVPGATDMIGVKARVTRKLAPRGFISIEGELWEAVTENGIIEAGVEVLVVGQKGLKLVVKPL
jgi:membrane-bound serine protease (ClpP class)